MCQTAREKSTIYKSVCNPMQS